MMKTEGIAPQNWNKTRLSAFTITLVQCSIEHFRAINKDNKIKNIKIGKEKIIITVSNKML